jgi:hypothetical protein
VKYERREPACRVIAEDEIIAGQVGFEADSEIGYSLKKKEVPKRFGDLWYEFANGFDNRWVTDEKAGENAVLGAFLGLGHRIVGHFPISESQNQKHSFI